MYATMIGRTLGLLEGAVEALGEAARALVEARTRTGEVDGRERVLDLIPAFHCCVEFSYRDRWVMKGGVE
jgi:hypothetical protein